MKRTLFTSILLLSLSAFLQAQALKIHHINVGQGDATLFVSPSGKTLLIDAGGDGKGTSTVLPYIQSLGLASLDYVVATHYHADHIGGLDEVITGLGAANIGTVYDRGTANTVPTSTVYAKYASAADSAGRSTLATGTAIDLGGGVSLKCVATDGSVLGYGAVSNATSSENDLSNAWLVTYGDFSYFTGGDCGGESSSYADLETPIASYIGGIGLVDAIKVNHHGSAYSTNATFVRTLSPTSAMLLVGDGNSYKHPVQAILDRLASANCYMYLTEQGNGGTVASGKGVVANGNIILSTTGSSTYSVSYGTATDTHALHYQSSATVSVSLSPAAASMIAGGQQQFTASVSNASSTSVTWTCTGGSITTAGLYTAPVTAGTYAVTATATADPTKSATAAVTVTAGTGTAYGEVESNGTLAKANTVDDTVATVRGFIGTTSDLDYFRLRVPANTTLTVTMTGPSSKNYNLYLYNGSGTLLKSSTGTTSTESVSYRNSRTSAVYYCVKVSGYNKACSATLPYQLTLTR